MDPEALEYVRIANRHMPELDELQQLYEAAFPVHERRPFGQLLQLLDRQPDMHCYAVKSGQLVKGLYIYWQLEGFVFLEHLAVSPDCRGQGIGQRLVQHLLRQSGPRLMLEVERPTDETSRRRIGFYQRLGFNLYAAYDYYQPPYRQGMPPVPLYLMASPPRVDAAALERLADVVHQQVYRRFYK